MRSLKGIHILSVLILVDLLVIPSFTFAQDLEVTKAGVVKITTNTGQTGAGLIVRVEQDMVYIITAAHVIAGDNQPKVEFFTKRNVPVTGAVLPGAEVNDDLRGLALVVVREKANIPAGVLALAFGISADMVSGGEEAVVIGHPGGGGNWAVLKRNISNRVGRDLSLDPGVASRFSGGPIMVNNKVVGIMMSNQDGFAKGITHKSVLNYMEGFGVVPSAFPIVDESKLTSPAKPKVPTGQVEPPPSVPSEQLPKTKTGKDRAPMVLVPAGVFTMGSPEGVGGENEHQQHTVELDAYYIDQYEVTVERYQRFLKDQSHRQPEYWDQVTMRRDAQKPVVGIDWHDAEAYCAWAGKRLPTEAEWEKAARGRDKRTYPWGESRPNSSTANFGKDDEANKYYANKLKAVGTYERGKSSYGTYDMAGNVWEWVADWYDADYYQDNPKTNPKGPTTGDTKVLRGGSWLNNPSFLRSAFRNWVNPTNRLAYTGVRCAQDGINREVMTQQIQLTPSSGYPSHSPSATKTGNDGMPMVLVPAGEFMMGSREGVGEVDEHPQHLVELDTFYLDTHEVTNQQFQKFVETTEYRTTAEQKGSAYGYSMKEEWTDIPGANWRQPEGGKSVFASGRGMHPVVAVSWEDATAYCSWAGKRLPTEAEWEYAARAGTTSEYWWGTGAPVSQKVGNLADETVQTRFPNWTIMNGYEDGYLRTAPVGIFEANSWGLHDMTGNAWEWVADWYDAEYYGNPSRRNPQGPEKGVHRVFRGGSWSDKPQDFRTANREKGVATLRRVTNGFRCGANAS